MLAGNRHIISFRYPSAGSYAFLGMSRSCISRATATIFAQGCACLQWQFGVVLPTHCSVLSIGSHGSILSIGSAGSILSVGSAASMLSIGGIGVVPGGRKK
jgi:hypothetical protein